MGAVYLAKDRNLGDAPRAVKEMVESHLDPAQHEKAIGDFKRESLLLTSLEHPSIPTIYDYFYDETLGRFYLVMKYISGGDLASRMRAAVGGRLDEKTVTDWGMQVADVLDYLHSRPKPIIYRDLEARQPDDRRQHGPSDADRFRHRALGVATGERRDCGRHDGICAAGAFQRSSAAGVRRLQSRRNDVSPVDRLRSAGQSASDF